MISAAAPRATRSRWPGRRTPRPAARPKPRAAATAAAARTVSGWHQHLVHACASLSGATLRTNIAQLSNNNSAGTGQPGASRPNLQLSGTTAVVAYEETACPGASGGQVHRLPLVPVLDPRHQLLRERHQRRHQERAPRAFRPAGRGRRPVPRRLRTLVLWRESPVTTPSAPADIVVRRGLAQPPSCGRDRPASCPPTSWPTRRRSMTDVAAIRRQRERAPCHRARQLRRAGLRPDARHGAANPEKTAPPTANYNLLHAFHRNGEPGSWAQR